MKKLFGRAAGAGAATAKKDGAGPLTNKTIQVGPHTVLVEHVLGLGGYGEIYRAVDISSGQRFALKHLRLDQENIGEVQREAKTMAKLRGHPNILRLHAVAFAGPKGAETDGFFLLDYCPGTLLDLMGRHKYMLENHTIIHIFGSVCHAVAAMHSQKPPMAHRDLKAENVLMLPDGTWVVCDFGSATSRAQLYDTPAEIAAEEEVISKHTTPAYRPPEMWDLQLMRTCIDTKVDIWALGVLLYVLCFGRLPFAGDSKLQIINARYDLPRTGHNRPPQLVALIPVLLQADPAQRPTIDQLLSQLDATARSVMGRSILQSTAAGRAATAVAPAVAASAAAAAAAVAAAPPALQAEGSFSGLAAAAAEDRDDKGEQQVQQQQQQQRQATAEQRAAQQQQFLREQQLRQYQQQHEHTMVQQQQAQHARLQQLQQQQERAGGSSNSRGGGSFWEHAEGSDSPTATASAGVRQQEAAGAASRQPASRLEQPPDWAHFSSPEQSPSSSAPQRPHAIISSSGASSMAAAATSSSAHSSGGNNSFGGAGSISSGKRSPPPPPVSGPQLSSASQGLRAHAVPVPVSPLASPGRVSAADGPLEDDDMAATPACVAVGGPSSAVNLFALQHSSSIAAAAERNNTGHMRWQPSDGGRPHRQGAGDQDADGLTDPKLAQLQDIKARAAAAAAALAEPRNMRNAGVGSSSSFWGSVSSLSSTHQPRVGDQVPEASFERQPRPYSSTSSGSAAIRQQESSPSWRSAPGVSGALAAEAAAASAPSSPAARLSRGSVAEQRRPSQEQPQRQTLPDQQQPVPSSSGVRSTCFRSDSSVRSDRSAVMAAHAPMPAPSVRSGSIADAEDLSSVLSEMQQLRREVQVLHEQNQAFVYRIKQLEEFTVEQQAAMRKLQLHVEDLQSTQHVAVSNMAHADGVGSSTDGGWYNPGRHAPC